MKLISKKHIKNNLKFVYDLEIEDNHNFLANNILVHNCKSTTAHTSKALLKITSARRKIAMTGTPIVNSPLDSYVVLKWLDIITVDYWRFKNTFAVFDSWGGVIGFKNIQQLSDILRGSMLRRTWEEVGKTEDAPKLKEKIVIDEVLEMAPKQSRTYKAVAKDYLHHIIAHVSSEERLGGSLVDLRKATAFPHLLQSYNCEIKDSIKLTRLKELLQEICIENKAVIVSNWTMITNVLKKELAEYNPCYITGEVSDKERSNEIDRFTNDPEAKIMIGTIGAMGVGLTLNAANYMIFFDEPWNEATYDQCVSRIYRIGQEKKVIVYNLLCEHTIDEKIHNLIRGKGEFADFMVDGVLKQNIDNKLLLEALVYDEYLDG